MVGQGEGRHPEFARPRDEVLDGAGAIEEAILAMDMEMDKA
jgi:hypothetical protein